MLCVVAFCVLSLMVGVVVVCCWLLLIVVTCRASVFVVVCVLSCVVCCLDACWLAVCCRSLSVAPCLFLFDLICRSLFDFVGC